MRSSRSGRAALRPTAALFAALAVAGWFGVSPADAQNEAKFRLKPGAAGKLCLECHFDFQDVLKQPAVHTPVKGGQCASCHSPHAADHGKLLAASPDAVCATCHGTMIPDGAASTHLAVVEGKCVSCHDPHASANKNQLVRSGNELCVGCHEDVKSSLASATHRHAPVDENCLGCHDPHASKVAASLLVKSSPSLCLDCHKPGQPGFAKAHMNYPVADADCTSCHDPHGSKNPGILWATVHAPVQNRMCNQCHEEATTGRVALKRPGSDLCKGCHNDLMLEIGAKSRPHWPVLDKVACANCHEPHASKTSGLLSKPQKQLCGSCHQDSVARQARSVTKHPPIEEGDCTSCHTPHAADRTFLFTGTQFDVCGSCHDWAEHQGHPLGDEAVDQRNPNLRVDCESCHRTHGTPFKHFTHGDSKGELCMSCHTQFTR